MDVPQANSYFDQVRYLSSTGNSSNKADHDRQRMVEIGDSQTAQKLSEKERLSLEGLESITREAYEAEIQERRKPSISFSQKGENLLLRTEGMMKGALLEDRSDVGSREVLVGARVNGQSPSQPQLQSISELMTSKRIQLSSMLQEIGALQTGVTEAGIYGQLRAGGQKGYVATNEDGGHNDLGFYLYEGWKREYTMDLEFTTTSGKTVNLNINMQEKVVEEGNFLNPDAPGEIRRYMDIDMKSSDELSEEELSELNDMFRSSDAIVNDFFDTLSVQSNSLETLNSSITSSEHVSSVTATFDRNMYYSFGDHTLAGYVDAELSVAHSSGRIDFSISNNAVSLTDSSDPVSNQMLEQMALGKTFLGAIRELG